MNYVSQTEFPTSYPSKNYKKKKLDKQKRQSRRDKKHPANYKIKALSNGVIPFIECQLGTLNPISTVALIDSGAVRSLISKSLIQQLETTNSNLIFEPENLKCTTANKGQLLITESVVLKIKIENFSWKFKFFICETLSVPVIIGCDFIHHAKLVPDLFNKIYFFGFRPSFKFELGCNADTLMGKLQNNLMIDNQGSNLGKDEQNRLAQVLKRYDDVLTLKLGLTNLTEYEIKLVSDKPVRKAPYQLDPERMNILNEEVKKMLKEGIIVKSQSNYASPVFLVPKANGSHRVVIDYRAVNKQISLDSVPLPSVETAFHWFHGAKYYTCLDLNQSYYQIPLKKECRHITSFCTMQNVYEFTRVPFGLSVGAQALSSVLDTLFEEEKFKFVYHYLDDIVIYSKDFNSHLKHIEIILSKLRNAGFTVNPEKAQFAKERISFLGHIVDQHGVSIDPSRTQKIRDFPPPKNPKGVARFIGMVGYFHKFIPNFAEIAAPINALRKKNVKFIWKEEHANAFEKLKKAITTPPILMTADFSKKFVLQTDGSSTAIAAVLCQEIDNILKPIAYASRKLTQQECKYSTYEIECLAAIWGMERFRFYLAHNKFLLLTDNSALSYVLNHPRQNGRMGRWTLRLLCFQFDVKHIPGKDNVIADCLSRMYQIEDNNIEQENKTEIEVDNLLNLVNSLNLSDFPLVFTDIKTHQTKDPFCNEILQKISDGIDQFPYSVSKGVLVYKHRNQDNLKIVVPKFLVPLVFKYFHSSPVGGHLGISKTMNKILENFYWKGIGKDIALLVKSCEICGKSKPAQKQNFGFLASKIVQAPMDKFYCDVVGPLVRSTQGHTHIFSCVDGFSKFSFLLPIRKANTNSIIKCLKSIFVNCSVPKSIVTDNASIFTSNKFKQFCFQLGIEHITTSPFYPNPNQVERLHRNLRSALIAFHGESQTKWDESLSWIPLAFNLSQHDSTGCTPFSLMYRFKPNHPLQNAWKIDDILPSKYTENTLRIWQKAKENLTKSHDKVKARYDKHRSPIPYKIGDLVWLKTHILSNKANKISQKLSYRWRGPYVIERWLSPVTAGLHDPDTGMFFQKAHVSHLKRYYPRRDDNGD